MKRFISVNIFFLLTLTTSFAQKDWQALKKEAEAADKKGNWGEAGNLYMDAYKQKEKNELVEKAADCFRKGREYSGLAGALELLKGSSRDKKAGYEYANALKQSGKYTDAIREFQLFINNYRGGKDYDAEEKRVNTQIQGCNLAIKLQKEGLKSPAPERIAKLCSTDNEATPRLVNGKELYFTSTMDGGKSKIFRSDKSSGGWLKPVFAFQFKGFEENVGNVTVCTESNRMYFTQFTTDKSGKKTSQIYGCEQKNGEWTAPVKLPEFINAKDAITTQPFALVVEGKEQLFFVSDRKGGQGGMDIWVASRNIQSDGFSFTLPVNLGPGVNTASDEMTPFRSGNELYFASNGLMSLGGFDIFKATKKGEEWGFSENLSLPINSTSDEFYFSKESDGTYFFTSNRLVKGQKAWYKDDDIFTNGTSSASESTPIVMSQLTGTIIDIAKGSGNLANTMVTLIDVTHGEKEVASKMSKDGSFNFEVAPQLEYRVEARKDGYKDGKATVKTNDFATATEFTTKVEMTRMADYKGKEGKVGEHEPIDEIKPSEPIADTKDTKSDSETKTPEDPKRSSEIKPILDETISFDQLTASQQDDIITLNGIEVIQVADGYKPVVRTKKVSSTPVATVNIPKGRDTGKKTTKKEDEGDAANDENGGSMTQTGDTKEGTPEKTDPVKTTPTKTAPATTTTDGITQKIQIAAETPGKYPASKYAFLAKMGATLETEPGPNGMERIVIVPTDGNIKALLKKIQAMPTYKGAFIAKYKNGVRI